MQVLALLHRFNQIDAKPCLDTLLLISLNLSLIDADQTEVDLVEAELRAAPHTGAQGCFEAAPLLGRGQPAAIKSNGSFLLKSFFFFLFCLWQLKVVFLCKGCGVVPASLLAHSGCKWVVICTLP